MSEACQKDERILSLYTRLQRGEVLQKTEEAQRFHVNEKVFSEILSRCGHFSIMSTVTRPSCMTNGAAATVWTPRAAS